MKEFWKYFKENIRQMYRDLRSKDKEKRRKQIPNILTIERGILAPITIIPVVICKKIYVAFILIAFYALTDAFDGWYARNRDAQSEFGAVLDCICDKLFVLTLAFSLVFTYTKWIIGIIVLEIVIAIINSLSKIKGFDPRSSIVGKIKTIILDVSMIFFYLKFIVNIPESVLVIFTVLTNVLQICSIVGYYNSYRLQAHKEKELNRV